jgi:hypothetical protein
MLLTPEQARELYQAMINCNDVDASFRFIVQHADGMPIIVDEDPQTWEVRVWIDNGETLAENYESQPAFAEAYGVPA